MGIELALFILVGSIAIFGAVMMLISENAVHSALFLILNFSAIAFLFLMLDAPFLAMVQITVYTGAIMVLFLFVIMLLGAEKVLTTSRQAISWMVPAAVGVVVTALFLATIIVLESEIETTEPEPTEPLLRIIHANSEVVPVDAYLDGELLASDVRFSEGTEFAEYDAGEYTLGLFPRDADPEDAAPLISEPVFLDEGDVVSLIVMPQAVEDRLILRVDGNLTALEDDKTARLTVVNALPCLAEDGCPITIADITDPDKDPRQFTEGLVYGGIAPVEILRRDEYSDHRYTLAAYEADTLEQATGDDEDTENAEPLERLSAIEVENNANLLWVLTADTRGERVRPRNVFLEVDNRPSFGSPRAIGETLFTSYLLPFEMIGLLLLISMVGVIVLTKEAERLVRRRTGVRRMATVPGNPTVEEYVKALKAGQPIPEESIKQLPGPSESSGD